MTPRIDCVSRSYGQARARLLIVSSGCHGIEG
jgi:hypothetical protein